jgi:hypothetical protein
MESIWIPYGMQIFHGIHMDSMWNMFGSIWNIEWSPYGIEIFHGFHMDSIWKEIFYGFHMEWTCIHSIWIPDGFHIHSIWIPDGFHIHSIWIPCPFHGMIPHEMGT